MILAVDVEEKERARLESLGLLPGVEINILARGAGPLLVAVGESRVVIERDIADGIIVA